MQNLGINLYPDDQKYVLGAYIHRFTGEHKPAWARQLRPNGQPYPLQFANDADWLAHTAFTVKRNGRLDSRASECSSTPTWPNNPELRRGNLSTIPGEKSLQSV